MEVVSMAAEIYASAAGTIAQIWILSELFPRKQSVKKVYIVGWICCCRIYGSRCLAWV